MRARQRTLGGILRGRGVVARGRKAAPPVLGSIPDELLHALDPFWKDPEQIRERFPDHVTKTNLSRSRLRGAYHLVLRRWAVAHGFESQKYPGGAETRQPHQAWTYCGHDSHLQHHHMGRRTTARGSGPGVAAVPSMGSRRSRSSAHRRRFSQGHNRGGGSLQGQGRQAKGEGERLRPNQI